MALKVKKTCVFFHFGLCLLIGLIVIPTLSRGEDLLYANAHYPPWVIVKEDGQMEGIDIEILKEISKRLNLNLKMDDCPWKRCLSMLKYGEIDIISTLIRRPDREKIMHYIDPPYFRKSTKAFYLKKGKGNLIQKYEDLYKISVGIVKGYKYFQRFDNENKIEKQSVVRDVQLLRMLERDRFEAFIGTEIVIVVPISF